MSSEPDELYTLRAQYWLGHYTMAVDEAKSIMRRPMSPELKLEREEFSLRSQLALGQHNKVIQTSQESSEPSKYPLRAIFWFDVALVDRPLLNWHDATHSGMILRTKHTLSSAFSFSSFSCFLPFEILRCNF